MIPNVKNKKFSGINKISKLEINVLRRFYSNKEKKKSETKKPRKKKSNIEAKITVTRDLAQASLHGQANPTPKTKP